MAEEEPEIAIEEEPEEAPPEPEVVEEPEEEPPPIDDVAAPTNPPPPPPNQDALSMEFLYYGSLLKIVAPAITATADKLLANPWIKKLFRPEYQTSKLRDKRNRFLVSLTAHLLNDEVQGIFQKKPPVDALPEIDTLPIEASPAAEWELDSLWQETLLALPDDFEIMSCALHSSKADCEADSKLNRILDQEFQFLLYLTRPYAALLPAEDKTRIASWIQTLCTIHGKACSSMKGIRNDYLTVLLGYLQDLRITGPFVDYPPLILEPLKDAAKKSAKTCPVTDPTCPEVNQFLMDQPIPEDGAFCYVAVTGDLVASNL